MSLMKKSTLLRPKPTDTSYSSPLASEPATPATVDTSLASAPKAGVKPPSSISMKPKQSASLLSMPATVTMFSGVAS